MPRWEKSGNQAQDTWNRSEPDRTSNRERETYSIAWAVGRDGRCLCRSEQRERETGDADRTSLHRDVCHTANPTILDTDPSLQRPTEQRPVSKSLRRAMTNAFRPTSTRTDGTARVVSRRCILLAALLLHRLTRSLRRQNGADSEQKRRDDLLRRRSIGDRSVVLLRWARGGEQLSTRRRSRNSDAPRIRLVISEP